MGEANYYFKARFRSADDAAAAEPRLAALLAEGDRAYDHWQAERSRPGVHAREAEAAGPFWAVFRDRFPLTTGYLGRTAGIPGWINGLAGKLGCLRNPHPPDPKDQTATLVRVGEVLRLRLEMIWHHTDMRLLEEYCGVVLGADEVGSLSDEELIDEYGGEDGELPADLDPFDHFEV